MAYSHDGKTYRSYKHPILEYIFTKAIANSATLPDEIIFTYEDIRQAMVALDIRRDKQASLSNFTIDLTRQAASHEARVPDTIWNKGYDLDRASDRDARQNIAGRLVRVELLPAQSWIVWPEIDAENVITVANQVPQEIRPYLGRDEGALLSVMDYCDILSLAFHQQTGTIKRVQHPKKWQPGEVDGLYFSNYADMPILYPVEAKALSTNDSVNLAQVQGAYKTIVGKIADVLIVPLAVQMIPEGMYIAVFEASTTRELVITRYLQIELDPPIEAWQRRHRRKT
ncbi:MAG: hypothetical protein ABI690_31500 [Chloroflexota bacterium]